MSATDNPQAASTSTPMKHDDNTIKAFVLAISGPSCSGKTTLSRLLRDTLSSSPAISSASASASGQPLLQGDSASQRSSTSSSNSMIIHQDDFYISDALIPVVRTPAGMELQDWDCREAIDFTAFEDMLRHIRRTGHVRDDFESKEDTNAVGHVDIDIQAIAGVQSQLRSAVATFVQRTGRRVVIVDGFLLFAQGLESLLETFDVKLLLTVGHETVKRRREARKGYVTLEGFWEDPPGYVDDIVWPNYVKDHRFLFRDGDVERDVDEDIRSRLGLYARPREMEEDMTQCFVWAAQLITDYIHNVLDDT